ncbi:hypothetical protein DXG01_013002, partial [Tephrocybe rancida]
MKVAVAKHLGLLALRLTDSFVVPLNTTQYALELDDYFDKVTALQAELPPSLASLDLSKLSKAISKVQDASLALDKEKYEAEKDFKRILRKLRHPHFPRCRKGHRFVRRIKDWIKGIFGVKPHHYQKISKHGEHETELNAWTKFLHVDGEDVRAIPPPFHHRHGLKPEHPEDGPGHPCHRKPGHHEPKHPKDDPDHPEPHHHHDHQDSPDHRGHPKPGRTGPEHLKHKHKHHGLPHPPKEIKKLIKAAKRIVKANKKIIAFERGFISEGGIKDREWYKHLGVAPGKWLGYGATTFPALTEALAFDKNVTLAAYEAERLS